MGVQDKIRGDDIKDRIKKRLRVQVHQLEGGSSANASSGPSIYSYDVCCPLISGHWLDSSEGEVDGLWDRNIIIKTWSHSFVFNHDKWMISLVFVLCTCTYKESVVHFQDIYLRGAHFVWYILLDRFLPRKLNIHPNFIQIRVIFIIFWDHINDSNSRKKIIL